MNRLTKLLLLFILPLLFACTQKEPEVQEVRVESVTISQSSAEIEIGKTLQLNATVSPSTATRKDITWSSSKSSVASVSSSGLVTAVSEGTTTITAAADGKKGECTVTVFKGIVAVSEIKLEKTEVRLYEGNEEALTATVLPEDASDKTITWSSSDNSVATVESGKVKAISEGTTTITASAGTVKAECKVSVFMKYAAVAITDLKPVDILPIVGQIEVGDKKAYDHIEHLRLAEATRIRDMMWEYGAGTHSKEEYRQLMGRLNVGMRGEVPLEYDNYEMIGDAVFHDNGSDHAHTEWNTLTVLLKHSDLKIVGETMATSWQSNLIDYCKAFPNTIVIIGCSSYSEASNKSNYEKYLLKDDILYLSKMKNFIIFAAGTNIEHPSGITKNKIYNGEYEADEHGKYSLCSMANSDKNTQPGSHLFVTVATNPSGDIDQTNEIYESSKFPVGFHNDVLFSGRSFPYHSTTDDKIHAKSGKIPTSHANYVNVAMMGICFQLYAEVKDVDELLEMVRSTCLTDHIRFEGQDQPLQLINHAGFIKKYLTPQNLPTTISTGETISLDKGYYKGVLFSIPGAEVKVNGEWIAYNNKNKDVIFSQNPMSLEWRLNGDLLKKYGYSSGQTVEGQIITVDDKWGGLRLEVPMTIQVR